MMENLLRIQKQKAIKLSVAAVIAIAKKVSEKQ